MDNVKVCRVQHLGLIPYQIAWDYQNQLAQEIAAGSRPDTLLLLEHPHVFTLGRKARMEHLLWDRNQMERAGVMALAVDRGGDITYHGPGQLVGYPLLRLAPIGWQGNHLPEADFVGYIRRLETVLIEGLSQLGIHGSRRDGMTGVWVPDHDGAGWVKIASIGVKVDAGGITRHGFAVNIDPDPTFWGGIVPCGLKDVRMTSMAAWLQKAVDEGLVREALVASFASVFNYRMVSEESRFGERSA